jgi:glycosyltransferase involved in cell wall biosynthesis
MIWVVVPALNEAENLQVLVPRIVKTLETMGDGGRVLVVDDGSTDNTTETMAELAAAWPGVSVETLRHNQGKAAALQRGFGIATEGGADVVVMMDADGQDDPDELPKLVARIEHDADLVTGARVVRNDRFIKRNTSKVYNRVTGMLSGAPGRDFNSGYKVMTADVARDVAPMMYGEMHRYLTVIAHDLGYRVVEEPVQHHARMSGTSKYGLARFWRGFSDLVTIRFLLSYENRPSHLFGGVGVACFLVGVLALAYLTVDKITGASIGDRPLLIAGVLFTLVGLQLVLFGLLAELVVHARNRDRAQDRVLRS